MTRQLKPETEIRNLRRELKRLQNELYFMTRDSKVFRDRTSKAEAAVLEWKTRFDALLSKVVLSKVVVKVSEDE